MFSKILNRVKGKSEAVTEAQVVEEVDNVRLMGETVHVELESLALAEDNVAIADHVFSVCEQIHDVVMQFYIKDSKKEMAGPIDSFFEVEGKVRELAEYIQYKKFSNEEVLTALQTIELPETCEAHDYMEYIASVRGALYTT